MVTSSKHFPRYWPFVRGIHRSPGEFPAHSWVNNGEADDLIRHRAHYDVIVMSRLITKISDGKGNRQQYWYEMCYPPMMISHSALRIMAKFQIYLPIGTLEGAKRLGSMLWQSIIVIQSIANMDKTNTSFMLIVERPNEDMMRRFVLR